MGSDGNDEQVVRQHCERKEDLNLALIYLFMVDHIWSLGVSI